MTAEYMINDNLSFSLDTRTTRLNNNFAFIGSPGSGKTHLNTFNIMNMTDRSHVIVDVKGNLSGLLDHFEKYGYKTYHFNLVDLDHSDTYSLFSYVDPENVELDLTSISNTLFGEVGGKDPFWDNAAVKLLMVCLCGIYEGFEDERRDLYKVNDYIKLFYTESDVLKKEIELLELYYKKKSKDSLFGNLVKTALPFDSDRTLDCILQSLDNRVFLLLRKKVCQLISQNGIRFEDFIHQKTCLIITIDDSDTTLHGICGLFLTQLFQFLYRESRKIEGTRLPISIHFHLDDFGSYYIKNFFSIISTARSRNIGITCLFQSQGQLKRLYEVDYETIMQCFDTILFFGGIDDETTKLIAKRSGNTYEFIAAQDLNTCYIIRRAMPVLYEKVVNLSDFEVPKVKKHSPTKIYKDEDRFDYLDQKIVSSLYVKLKSMTFELEEYNDRRPGKKDVKISLDQFETRLLHHILEELEIENKNLLMQNIEKSFSFFNIVPDNLQTSQVEFSVSTDILPELYEQLEPLLIDGICEAENDASNLQIEY